MIYQIHQVNHGFIVGSVIDKIDDFEWIVVADIPRQMVKRNRVRPQHITLVSGESDESFSADFERIWTEHMTKRLRNWLIREHYDKLYPYENRSILIDNNSEDDSDDMDKQIYCSPEKFFNIWISASKNETK